ncbi:hypothetical protein Slin15195_G011880 [Septoria linicola]|uniref:Uncharacterized protein n=1 Tax=Septoria linicola TaxID=215465 RepID=A0A9Q9AE79_9PEZI|nr:hypothetical protein Slin14017_G011890 [Septoria linicola]USW47869.1 hypothetical protein Slin15195_G011880 [Septoria linicola]
MAHRREEDGLSPNKALPKLRTTPDVLSPTRSRTDAPDERSHLHRRLHSASLRNRAFTGAKEHGYRHAAKETVQSAIDLKPPISFDSLLRRDKKGAHSTRGGSSKYSSQQQTQRQLDVDEWSAQQAQLAQKPQVKPEDIAKAKKENASREVALRKSLGVVEDIAMASTRELDDTYYAILEKASQLRNTVASLQQLAEDSRTMHQGFMEETEQLQRNAKSSLDGFANFAPQEQTINTLVDRLKHSKHRTNLLNDRLEAARHRVEAYEEREKRNRKASRQRWSAAWITIVGLVVFVIAVLLARNRGAVGNNVPHMFDQINAMLAPAPKVDDSILSRLFDSL